SPSSKGLGQAAHRAPVQRLGAQQSRTIRGEHGQRYFDSNCGWHSRGNRVRNSTLPAEEESSALVACRIKVKTRPSAIDPVRCRYCIAGDGFFPMVAHLDGRYICNRCGHIEMLDVAFECNCGSCAGLKRFAVSRDVSPMRRAKP